jgi:hypothetical protein
VEIKTNKMITVKIDVNKIDKAQLFTGKKGVYLDLVLIETPNDQFGNDYVVKQNMSREDREAGKQNEILGNAKNFVKKQGGAVAPSKVDDTDDLPF